jgi:hypothetical protein
MGHGLNSDLERLSKALLVDANGHSVDLSLFKQPAQVCAIGSSNWLMMKRRRLHPRLRQAHQPTLDSTDLFLVVT